MEKNDGESKRFCYFSVNMWKDKFSSKRKRAVKIKWEEEKRIKSWECKHKDFVLDLACVDKNVREIWKDAKKFSG